MIPRTTICGMVLIFALWATLSPIDSAAGMIPETAKSPLPSSCRPAIPSLGKPPELPAQPKLLPSVSLQATPQATGFTVTTTSREQSRNFFNALYPASDNVPIGWTGNLAACSAGTTADPFKEAVQLRINYFRAMAGVPAAITFSDIFSAKSQQAALMMSKNNELSHDPPHNWPCYTADGDEAAGKSNLALGFFGAGAISGYVLDHGGNNSAAGHRRWLLYPQTQLMGTGDIPGASGHYAANSLWVSDSNSGNPRPVTRDDFVAWPPPGYVPYQVVYPRWSLSYQGADFRSATVTMIRDGASLPVRLEQLKPDYGSPSMIGENTLVWIPDNMDTNSTDSFPRPAADAPYTVTVGNVLIGGAPRSFSYTVTLFDPETPGPDHVSTIVSGPTSPYAGHATTYTITPVPDADSYQWRSATTPPFTGSYDAESGLAGITATVSANYYNPISMDISASGAASYHMAHPTTATGNPTDQILTLDRTFLAGPSSKLRFQSRLTIASPNQKAMVEVSTDNGATWSGIFEQPGIAVDNNGDGYLDNVENVEQVFTARTLDLSAYAEKPIRVRFAYRVDGFYLPQTDPQYGVYYFGWYLDDITFVDTRELSGTTASPTIPTPSLDFSPPAEGDYILQARALLYGKYPLEWGPVLRVTAVGASPFSLTVSVTGNGTVTSDPTGISCPYGDCAKLFPAGKPVLLMATPDATNYLFGGWSGGGCGGIGDCSVPMTTATSVTARFDYVQPIRVPLATPTDYSSLTLAYGAVPDGGSIMARAFIFPENLVLNVNKRVFLRGGYNTGFSGTIGSSVLNGRLTVSQGSLVVAGLVIR